MDFNINKPAHILALLILIIALGIILLLPIYSYFNEPVSVDSTPIEESSEFTGIIFEIFLLVVQILLVAIGIFILVPLIWYFLVNKLKFKEILNQIKIRKAGMDMAILWGIISMISMFMILFIAGLIITFYGYNLDNSSNITDLEQLFSLPSIFFIVAFQPIGEEIFFRGFLLDKLKSLGGREVAIIVTSILFGLAHLSYQNIYPAIMTGILGLILAYMVLKTKNLLTSIVAHILFNLASVSLYIIGQSYIY